MDSHSDRQIVFAAHRTPRGRVASTVFLFVSDPIVLLPPTNCRRFVPSLALSCSVFGHAVSDLSPLKSISRRDAPFTARQIARLGACLYLSSPRRLLFPAPRVKTDTALLVSLWLCWAMHALGNRHSWHGTSSLQRGHTIQRRHILQLLRTHTTSHGRESQSKSKTQLASTRITPCEIRLFVRETASCWCLM